jgi:hypothetical protein
MPKDIALDIDGDELEVEEEEAGTTIEEDAAFDEDDAEDVEDEEDADDPSQSDDDEDDEEDADPSQSDDDEDEESDEDEDPDAEEDEDADPVVVQNAGVSTPGASDQSIDLSTAVAEVMAELPEDFEFNGKKFDIKGMTGDFEDIMAMSAYMAQQIVQKAMGPVMPVVRDLGQQRAADAFFGRLEAKVPGARQTAAAPEFQQWLQGQPKAIQGMASSDDIEDAAYVLSLYAPNREKAPAKRVAAPAGKKPEAVVRKQRALTGSLRNGNTGKRRARRVDMNDYDGSFDEE